MNTQNTEITTLVSDYYIVTDENGYQLLDEEGEPIVVIESRYEVKPDVTVPDGTVTRTVEEYHAVTDENGYQLLDEDGSPIVSIGTHYEIVGDVVIPGNPATGNASPLYFLFMPVVVCIAAILVAKVIQVRFSRGKR
jgi:flagellar basal body rod protein FlgG